MIIRQVTKEDVPNCLDLLKEFQEEALKKYGTNIDPDQILSTVEHYLEYSFVAEHDGKIVGILAGQAMKIPAADKPIYHEAVWYVSKAHRRVGIHLLKTLEQKCRETGIGHIIMAHMYNSMPDALAKFYIRSGYRPFEIHYIKNIKEVENEVPAT